MPHGRLNVWYSPDPDDVFIFYPLRNGLLGASTPPLQFHEADLGVLNRLLAAAAPRLDASMVSAVAALQFSERVYIARSGGAFAEGRGPVIVASRKAGRIGTLAVPGDYTTAGLLAHAALGFKPRLVVAEPHEIPRLVATGDVDAGVLIHEHAFNYEDLGLQVIVDLWEWWSHRTGGLPLPLGVFIVRRDLGLETARLLSGLVGYSVRLAWLIGEPALRAASGYSVNPEGLLAYLELFAGRRAVDMGRDGVEALMALARIGGLGEPVVVGDGIV